MIILRTGMPINFVVDRGGREILLTATPVRGPCRTTSAASSSWAGSAWASPSAPATAASTLWPARRPWQAASSARATSFTTTVFYIGRMVTGRESADQISGPLGMAQISGDLAKQTAERSTDLGELCAVNAVLTSCCLVANISVGHRFPEPDADTCARWGTPAVLRL